MSKLHIIQSYMRTSASFILFDCSFQASSQNFANIKKLPSSYVPFSSLYNFWLKKKKKKVETWMSIHLLSNTNQSFKLYDYIFQICNLQCRQENIQQCEILNPGWVGTTRT